MNPSQRKQTKEQMLCFQYKLAQRRYKGSSILEREEQGQSKNRLDQSKMES